jgi:hypothetical protein
MAKSKKLFQCEACGSIYHSERVLKRHLERQHGIGRPMPRDIGGNKQCWEPPDEFEGGDFNRWARRGW